MPLKQPPNAAGALAALPGHELADTTLHRVWRHDLADGTTRSQPWFFASVPDDPEAGGRFDLPSALGGTCYLADRPVVALLEALQTTLPIIPEAELRLRRRTEIQVPTDAPVAADLMAAAATGFGVTSGLWAASERTTTQAWAAALRRDGWWAAWAGAAQHDTTNQGRAVPLFDATDGPHPPSGQQWCSTSPIRLDTDLDLLAALADRGCHVRGPGNLPGTPDPTSPDRRSGAIRQQRSRWSPVPARFVAAIGTVAQPLLLDLPTTASAAERLRRLRDRTPFTRPSRLRRTALPTQRPPPGNRPLLRASFNVSGTASRLTREPSDWMLKRDRGTGLSRPHALTLRRGYGAISSSRSVARGSSKKMASHRWARLLRVALTFMTC